MPDTEDGDEFDLAALESITFGAGVSVVSLVAQKCLQFGTNLVLTHGLGVAAYGLYALGRRIVRMLLTVSHLGTKATLQRYLPEYDGDRARQNRLVGQSYLTVLVAGGALAAALFAFAPRVNALTAETPLFVPVLRVMAVLIPLNVLVSVTSGLFRGLELVEYQALVFRLARPGAILVAAAGAIAVGTSVLGVAIALVLSMAFVAAGAGLLALFRTEIRPALTRSRTEVVEFYTYSLPVAASGIGRLLRTRVDVVLVGFFLTASAAGIYNVALFLAGLVALPLISFNQLLPPVASHLYSEGRVDEVDAVYSLATRWILTGGLAIAAVEVVYGDRLLRLFGPEYVAGNAVLMLFVFGQLVSCAVGSAGWLLMMTDHQYVQAVNNWLLGAVNVVASYLFILEFGLVGAAMGTATALAAMNVLRVAELYHFEGLFPLTRAFYKPLLAAAAMVAALLGVEQVLGGAALLVVGPLVGLGVYALVLAGLGVESADRRVAAALAADYRARERPPTSRD